jgi:hypothetical protein
VGIKRRKSLGRQDTNLRPIGQPVVLIKEGAQLRSGADAGNVFRGVKNILSRENLFTEWGQITILLDII